MECPVVLDLNRVVFVQNNLDNARTCRAKLRSAPVPGDFSVRFEGFLSVAQKFVHRMLRKLAQTISIRENTNDNEHFLSPIRVA